MMGFQQTQRGSAACLYSLGCNIQTLFQQPSFIRGSVLHYTEYMVYSLFHVCLCYRMQDDFFCWKPTKSDRGRGAFYQSELQQLKLNSDCSLLVFSFSGVNRSFLSQVLILLFWVLDSRMYYETNLTRQVNIFHLIKCCNKNGILGSSHLLIR